MLKGRISARIGSLYREIDSKLFEACFGGKRSIYPTNKEDSVRHPLFVGYEPFAERYFDYLHRKALFGLGRYIERKR